jgi:hypothetical protein
VLLVRHGLITPDDAGDTVTSPHDFMLALKAAQLA